MCATFALNTVIIPLFAKHQNKGIQNNNFIICVVFVSKMVPCFELGI